MLCGALLRRLQHHHGESTIYAIGTSRGFFCGATPERLVALRNDEVHTDALAGTAWAGTSLAVEKNFREQRLVVESIRRALAPLCSTINVPETPEVMRLRDLQHLHTPIVGRTHPGVGLFDLLSRLHPTPAVGGWPRRAACDWLRRHDEQRPGWYAGGFGWIDRNGNGEVAVALRCGLLAAGCMELSAGAGIVTGSNADAEYEETDIKLQTMLAALRDEGEGGMLQTGTAG
jgi:isochorismate synthase